MDEPLLWEGQLIKPLHNMIMHTKLGLRDIDGMKHVTKIGVQTKDGIQIERTTLLLYGDVLVLPLLFILLDPLFVACEAGGGAQEFYCARRSKFLAAVLSTAGVINQESALALLPMAWADSRRNLLSTAPHTQHVAAIARQNFRKVWTAGLKTMEDHIIFTMDDVIEEAERQGNAIMRRKQQSLSSGECLISTLQTFPILHAC